jgi:hypothetical protein
MHEAELERFLRGEIDLAAFPHREHVRMGFEMLKEHSFPEVAWRYSSALRTMTQRAGKPHLFHQTITIAFLSLIAERMASGDAVDFSSFAQAHPDLLAASALRRWYRPERLASELARRTFLLPEPLP